jgi:hypothetical protein
MQAPVGPETPVLRLIVPELLDGAARGRFCLLPIVGVRSLSKSLVGEGRIRRAPEVRLALLAARHHARDEVELPVTQPTRAERDPQALFPLPQLVVSARLVASA